MLRESYCKNSRKDGTDQIGCRWGLKGCPPSITDWKHDVGMKAQKMVPGKAGESQKEDLVCEGRKNTGKKAWRRTKKSIRD